MNQILMAAMKFKPMEFIKSLRYMGEGMLGIAQRDEGGIGLRDIGADLGVILNCLEVRLHGRAPFVGCILHYIYYIETRGEIQ